MDVLCAYSWPGNVRELENLIQYLVFIRDEDIIGLSSLPLNFLPVSDINSNEEKPQNQDISVTRLENLEHEMILKTVAMFDNTTEGKLKAARALGISKSTLYRKLAEFNKK